MKVLLLLAVSAWVVTVTADRPCAEYCVYLSSGTRNIEFQTGCDCTYEASELQDQLDDSSIYYGPVDFSPIPAYINNRRFNVLNPIIRGRQTYYSDNNRIKPENVQTPLNVRKYNNEIEVNMENTYTIHNRQQKNIKYNNQGLKAPFYLDINIESQDVERSVSTNTFTTEELEQTEQSFLECADNYDELHSKKNTETNAIKTSSKHFSNTEARKVIENMCSHISLIIEKSLSEIRNTRPKPTSDNFRLDEEHHGHDVHPIDPYDINKQVISTSTTENNLQAADKDSDSRFKEHDENVRKATIDTDSDENTSDNFSTLSSTTTAPASITNYQSSTDGYTNMEDIGVTMKSTDAHQSITSANIGNEYPLHKATVALHPTTTTSEPSTFTTHIFTSTKTTKQELLDNQPAAQEYKAASVTGLSGNRSHYQEGEVPLAKIITHEFSNGTVQSFINGTENIPNGDFSDEAKHTESVNKTEDHSHTLPYNQYTGSTPGDFEISTLKAEGQGTANPDISGNLYFVFNKHQIPARFVQKMNGSLYLGLDGVTICESLTQNGKHNSALLTTLCNCYKSGNCSHKESD